MQFLRHWIDQLVPRPLIRHAFALGMMGFMLTAILFMTGCAGLPVWLTDAENFLPIALASISSILTAIGVISGNPVLATAAGLITTIVNDVMKGINDLQAMVNEYKASPNVTLLSSIEAGAQAVIDNIQKLLGDFGLPAELSAPFVSLAQLILTQFEAWVGVLPTLKLAYQDHDVAAVKAAAASLTSIPLTADQFKEAFNNIVIANPQFGAITLD